MVSLVFVYGTLKEGFPNFGLNTGRRIGGSFRTRLQFPLHVVRLPHEDRAPWLMATPGRGCRVSGQVFEVDAHKLAALDAFEGVGRADGYVRVEIELEASEAPGVPLRAFAYMKREDELARCLAQEGPFEEYTHALSAGYRLATVSRFVAFLRGASPVNAKMPELKACFERAGFANVRTVLSSGNVVFDSHLATEAEIQERAEGAMAQELGRPFRTLVRPSAHLHTLLATAPYDAHGIPPHAKRVVSFLRVATVPRVPLPLAQDLASVFLCTGREVFTAYVPTEKGPVFMNLIEKAFGTDVTTRTLDTVARCAAD